MAEKKDFGLEILISRVLGTLIVPINMKNGDLYFLSKDFYVKALFQEGEFSVLAAQEKNKSIKSIPYESGIEEFVEAEKQKDDKKCLGFVPIHESAEVSFRKMNLKPIAQETEFLDETMYKIYRY